MDFTFDEFSLLIKEIKNQNDFKIRLAGGDPDDKKNNKSKLDWDELEAMRNKKDG